MTFGMVVWSVSVSFLVRISIDVGSVARVPYHYFCNTLDAKSRFSRLGLRLNLRNNYNCLQNVLQQRIQDQSKHKSGFGTENGSKMAPT